jgi:hypothetical protein
MKNAWVFNCRDVAEKISRSMDERLPLYQRLGIRFHISMCRLCARHRRQLLRLRRFIRFNVDNNPAWRLSDEEKDRLLTEIHKAGGEQC